MTGYNLPPGVTDAMVDAAMSVPERCEDCDRFEDCPWENDEAACADDEAQQAAETRQDCLEDR